MFSERFFRNYRRILTVGLVLLVIPILWAMFYVRPVLDDLGQPLPVMRAWRDTGSVVEMIRTVFSEVKTYYMEFSGIFFTMFLSILPLSIFHDSLISVHVMALFVLLVFSLYYAGRSVLRTLIPDISCDAASCAGLLLCMMVVLFMPSYQEGFFWYMGAMGYSCIFSLALWLFSGLLHGVVRNSKNGWLLAALSIGFFFLGGANWVTPTASIVIYGALAVWIIAKGRDKRYLLPFAFLLAGYLVAIAAPGNALRASDMNVDVPVIQAGIQSIARAAQFAVSDGMHYLFLLLFLPVCCEAARRAPVRRYPVWLPVLSVCVLGANMFPLVYQSAYWANRHTNACFQLLSVLLVMNLFVLVCWITQRRGGRPLMASPRGMTALGLAAVLAIGLVSVKDADWNRRRLNCSLQPATLVMNLLDGSIQRYAQEYDELTAYVAAHAGEDIVIPFFDIPTNEMVGPHMGMFSDNPTEWRNTGFAGWWGGEGTTIIYEYDPQ